MTSHTYGCKRMLEGLFSVLEFFFLRLENFFGICSAFALANFQKVNQRTTLQAICAGHCKAPKTLLADFRGLSRPPKASLMGFRGLARFRLQDYDASETRACIIL